MSKLIREIKQESPLPESECMFRFVLGLTRNFRFGTRKMYIPDGYPYPCAGIGPG